MGFEIDPIIQEIAEAYALDAISFARARYWRKLDWTDESVRYIEEIAAHLHETMPVPRPSEEKIFGFAKMLGSYVGEVFRKNHGAEWGLVSIQGERFPGLKGRHDGVTFWPWGRVHNRLVKGSEDNIWHYYQVLLSEHTGPK